ncbi:uncharacterized protein TRUGW13939_11797 [Talaromyces rugulosus]|uniref:Nucleoside phosphorylase domain-containing protein n=1 Tax=Talaromyces rugulosus TaxID=121627 RepID=A0A7H8RDR0_TALRU|nr:uncharacterized protein TRUGW13939_11797 [Talaromyces rugulosus]QKX64622.1 hypothetical protein TRUGW13939_11797 [Talaromyces rugulosus]
MLDEEHEKFGLDGDDTNIYTLGRIDEHNVVIVSPSAGEKLGRPAATVAAQIRSSFPSIQFALIVGIGAGVPTAKADIRLGDVVVSQPNSLNGGIVKYALGKEPNEQKQTGHVPPSVLQNAISVLRTAQVWPSDRFMKFGYRLREFPMFRRENTGPDLLFEAGYPHVGGPDCRRCDRMNLVERKPRSEKVKVHYGTIASSNRVIRDAIVRDKLSSHLGGVLCIEIDAADLMNIIPCLHIRGICDYADSHNNSAWKPYAAGSAAVYAKQLLSVIDSLDTMTLLLDQNGADFPISEEIVKMALAHRDAVALIDRLLDKRGVDFPISEETAKIAASNSSSAREAVELISKSPGDMFFDQKSGGASDSESEIFSLPSVQSTAVTNNSSFTQAEIRKATDKLVDIFLGNDELNNLYKLAMNDQRIGPDRFVRNFKRLLQAFSRNLKKRKSRGIPLRIGEICFAKSRFRGF